MTRNAETNIQNAVLLAIGSRADCMAWRNQTGGFRAMDNPQRIIRVGDVACRIGGDINQTVRGGSRSGNRGCTCRQLHPR